MQPKRLLISVLVVILMFGAAVMSVAAAQTPFDLTVAGSDSTVVSNEPVFLQAGDKLEVILTLNSNPNAAHFSFYLDYDKDAFTIETDADGRILYKVGDVYPAGKIGVIFGRENRVKCSVDDSNSTEDNNKTGVLITFTFTVKKDFHGEADIAVAMDQADIIDRNWDEVPVKLNNKLVGAQVHDFVGEPKEDKGDCTTDATLTYKCSKCGDIVLTTGKAPGHKEVVDAAVEATCTEAGKTAGSHCEVCNEVIKAQDVIPALGHTEVTDAAVEATCTTAGLTEGKHCSVCNAVTVAQEEVPAKGHTEVIDEAVEPTYSETGLTEGKHCSVCNEVLKAQETVAKKSALWIWVLIIVVILAIGGGVAYIFIKKKKK